MESTFRLKRRGVLATAVLASLQGTRAFAQQYPTKPVRVIVPWAAGGGTDVVFRKIAPALGEKLGQTIVIDNRGGATGSIGSAQAAQAPADGYTLVLGTADSHSIVPHLYKKLAYDSRKDFVAISPICFFPYALAVHPSVPVNTAAEFVQYAKREKNRVTFASWGVGSSAQIAMEMFKAVAGIEVLHVPYTSTAPMMLGLVSGQVNAAIVPMPLAEQYTKSGSIRLLGLAGPKRFAGMPELPTLAEQGYPVNSGTWVGLLGPAAMPAAAVARVHDAVDQVMATPAANSDLLKMFVQPVRMSQSDYQSFILSEYDRWGQVIRDAKISIES